MGIATRYRWWIALPAVVTTFATLFVLTLIPNRYSSEATLLVVQQQVPERYVLPTTTTNIREALQATTEEVLSRAEAAGDYRGIRPLLERAETRIPGSVARD